MKVKSKHIFDRSDPHEVIAIYPDGRRATRLDELRKGGIHRCDIGLVNVLETCPTCGEETIRTQYCVYATWQGLAGRGLEFFNEDEKRQLEQIRQKLIEVSKGYPEMSYYLEHQY